MNNRLGLSSYAYYWASEAARQKQAGASPVWLLLEKAAELGLHVVQICENVPLQDLSRSSLEQLGQAARRRSLTLETGTRGLDLDHLRRYMEITHELGGRIMRVTPWSGLEYRQQTPNGRLREAVNQLLPLCWKYDITLAIENYFDLPDQALAAFVREVNDAHVGVCLDTANSVGQLEQPLKTVELLAPFAVSLHLKDFVLAKLTMGFRVSGVPLGQGWLDVPAALALVRRSGREPNVLLELWVEPAETEEATLKKEDDWVRQSAEFARHHLG